MRPQSTQQRKRSAGFGLVEIMVAVLIGMFGVLIMLQVLSVSEEQKRTTVAGNDSMNEGVLALYELQQDIRMAGYGISDAKILGCALTLRSGVVLPYLAPVIINSSLITGADTNTDTLLIFYANTYGATKGDTVTSTGNQMQSVSTFSVGDYVVDAPASRPSNCSLTLDSVTAVSSASKTITLNSASTVPTGDTVFNFGQSYRAIGYAVRSGNLTVCDFSDSTTNCATSSNWRSISNNIVSLRAQYGQDTTTGTMDGVVDVYNQTTPTTLCTWARMPAIRFVVVSRSEQMEKAVVTAAASSSSSGLALYPTWDGTSAGNPTGSTAAAIDLTGNANYQYYRYRPFQLVVPIRNISWLGQVTGC